MHRTLCCGLALAILPFCPGLSLGQTPIDLDVLRADASERNATLLASSSLVEAAQHAVAASASYPDPMVGLTASPLPIHTARGVQRLALRVEQALPRRDERSALRNAAESKLQAAEFGAQRSELDVLADVAVSYYRLASVQARAALLRAFRHELERFEEAAAVQYETGAGPQQALLKAQIESNRVRRQALALDGEVHGHRERLTWLSGKALPPDARAQLPSAVPDVGRMAELGGDDEPGARALEASAATSEAARRSAEVALRPRWSVHASWMEIAEADIPASSDGRDALGIGASVRIPLSRGSKRAAVAEQAARRQALLHMADDRRLQVHQSVQATVARIDEGVQSLDLVRRILIPQAETALEAALAAYTNGTTDFLNLLDAERTLLALRLDAIETHQRVLEDAAELERLTGHPPAMRALEDSAQ